MYQKPGVIQSSFGYEGQYIGDQNQYSTTSNPLYSGLVYMKNRYYDPATGVFVSQDPLINQTNQAYVYSNDNPVGNWDPSGKMTVGFCGSLAISAGIYLSSQACLTRTVGVQNDDIGIVGTAAFGGGPSFSGSVNGAIQITNAPTLDDLRGPFVFLTLSAGEEGQVGLNVFIGDGSNNKAIIGVDIFGGVAFNLTEGLPVSFAAGFSVTGVHIVRRWEVADVLRGLWDQQAIVDNLSPLVISRYLKFAITNSKAESNNSFKTSRHTQCK